jgi:hypothetical protein
MSNCNSFNVPSGCSNNPCSVHQHNTATCESLPSQISNFTLQFFGTVVKTEIDGAVSWSLPCGLDTGLPNNPRGVDEGLACYFLRLFSEGIVGLTGPPGPQGCPGTDGFNAYTVTLESFTQPTADQPNVTVVTQFSPVILTGMNVFIATSGYYLVTGTDASGLVFLTLVKPVSGASGTITAGKIIVPTGPGL